MFCSASRYQTQPESVSEVVRIMREHALPLVSRQPGFRGVYLLTKPNGEFMILNIWDTEEQAIAWQQHPEHQPVRAQLKPLLSGGPARDGYEVQAYAIP